VAPVTPVGPVVPTVPPVPVMPDAFVNIIFPPVSLDIFAFPTNKLLGPTYICLNGDTIEPKSMEFVVGIMDVEIVPLKYPVAPVAPVSFVSPADPV
jgi:hypothetical protein